MERIKADFHPTDERFPQQLPDTMNQKERTGMTDNMDTVESKSNKDPMGGPHWVIEGVAFPSGTEFRCKYKGYFYYGNVKSGALVLNGKEFLSPCEAAVTITRNPVDGWLLWDCKLPGTSSWVSLHTLKQMK